MTVPIPDLTIGVLALQGAFSEHVQLLRHASSSLPTNLKFAFIEVRTPTELSQCDGLIIPGGESTAISLVAARSGLLEPLRDFVKVLRRPTWGTCAGLILLAESANRTKKGGQDLIGGLDVRVNRNHFGRQQESFQANLNLTFLGSTETISKDQPSRCDDCGAE
jgi:5'-phosphate synthase pdxT subunit